MLNELSVGLVYNAGADPGFFSEGGGGGGYRPNITLKESNLWPLRVTRRHDCSYSSAVILTYNSILSGLPVWTI